MEYILEKETLPGGAVINTYRCVWTEEDREWQINFDNSFRGKSLLDHNGNKIKPGDSLELTSAFDNNPFNLPITKGVVFERDGLLYLLLEEKEVPLWGYAQLQRHIRNDAN